MSQRKIDALRALAERGATDGERQAARKALARLEERPPAQRDADFVEFLYRMTVAASRAGRSYDDLRMSFQDVQDAITDPPHGDSPIWDWREGAGYDDDYSDILSEEEEQRATWHHDTADTGPE